METPAYIDFLSADPLFKEVLSGQESRQLKRVNNLTFYLYATIVKQQLSTRVGDVILKRFLTLYDGREPMPAEVLETADQTFRNIGISGPKTAYIKNIACFALENGLDIEKLDRMTDEEVLAHITRIKGIGRWTAHLFLLSALGREDIFPADDLILQKAVAAVYSLDRTAKKQFMENLHTISAKWSPFRSYASLHLWRWASNNIK